MLTQSTSLPEKPELQLQEKPPSLLAQEPTAEQLLLFGVFINVGAIGSVATVTRVAGAA